MVGTNCPHHGFYKEGSVNILRRMKRIVLVVLIACMALSVMAGAQKNAKVDKPKKVYLNSKMHIIPVPDKWGIYAFLTYDEEHIQAKVYNSKGEVVYKLQFSELTSDTCVYDGIQEHYFFGELHDTYRYANNIEKEHTYFRDGRPIFRAPLQVGDTIWYYYRTMCFREEASGYSVVEQPDSLTGFIKVKHYILPSHELLEEFTYSRLSYGERKYTGRQYEYYKGKKRFVDNYNADGKLLEEYELDTLGKVISIMSFVKRTADSTLFMPRYTEMKYFYPDGHLRAKKSRNKNGELEVQYFMPDGSISDNSTIEDWPQIEHDADYAYYNAEQNPAFPGGSQALRTYLSQNCKYPPEAKQKGIRGNVIVSFTVETDGSISEVVVLRPVHKLLNDEAVRVIQAMPKWIPGKINGKAVRVRREVPLNFQL